VNCIKGQVLGIKKALVTVNHWDKSCINFCGTTRFGAKHPLNPYTNIYAPFITDGDSVRHYSAVTAFLPTLVSPFITAVITAITPPAVLWK
jgi:hypothetical protein